MTKFILLALFLLVLICTAESARKNIRQSRFLSRQEEAENVGAKTPYPPSGFRPDIPFDLPNESSGNSPDVTLNFPNVPTEDNPIPSFSESSEASDRPINSQQTPEEPEAAPQQPDNTYLPPDSLLPPAQTYGPPSQVPSEPEASGEGLDDVTDNVESESKLSKEDQDEQFQDDGNEVFGLEPESQSIESPESERIVLAKSFRSQSVRPTKLQLGKLTAVKSRTINAPKLQSTELKSAKLTSSNLRSTKLKSAKLMSTKFKPSMLRSAKLEVVRPRRIKSQRLVVQPIYATNGSLLAYKMLGI